MCYKILQANKEIVFRTTVRPLTLVELADPCHIKMRADFDTQIADRLGAAPTMNDFEPSDLTPDCIYYEDDETSCQEGSPDEILPTPEGNDNYVNVEIMLPRGDEMAMGRVTKRACDSDGNPLGNANDNPILNTHQYIVQFTDGDEAELTTNVIAINMYAQ